MLVSTHTLPLGLELAGAPFIGIEYGLDGTKLPGHHEAIQKLQKSGVKNVKIYDVDQKVLEAFRNSGIMLSVAVPNDKVVAIADSQRLL